MIFLFLGVAETRGQEDRGPKSFLRRPDSGSAEADPQPQVRHSSFVYLYIIF